MSVFKEITELDKLLHEPARLAIMTVLSGYRSADFTFLLRMTGLSKGNLSSHLSKLEEAKLVTIQKSFVGKMPNTTIRLTESGTKAINDHWQKLEEMRNGVRNLEIKNQAEDIEN